ENPKGTVDTVKQQRTLESDLGLNQPRNQQRKSNKDEDVDYEGNDETASDHPRRDLCGITFAFLRDGFFGKRFLSRKTQGANAENQSLAQDSDAASNWSFKNLPFVTQGEHQVFHDADGAVLPPDGDGVALRGPHHHPFDYGLP